MHHGCLHGAELQRVWPEWQRSGGLKSLVVCFAQFVSGHRLFPFAFFERVSCLAFEDGLALEVARAIRLLLSHLCRLSCVSLSISALLQLHLRHCFARSL